MTNNNNQYNFWTGLGTCQIHGRVCMLSKSIRNQYGHPVQDGESVCEKCLVKLGLYNPDYIEKIK